ncbi:MAG: hypothetical protein M1819_003447 [Sarea resinae]|nr:MAG: hypothetical protein M1819_003447 [Sarea resinae]
MDYQYKSIHRGEKSIAGQIKAEGVDPKNHIFFFNLRSYDRINMTPKMREQEEKSGVKYQDVQRAEAEEIMGENIHGVHDHTRGDKSHADDTGHLETQRLVDRKREFEAQRDKVGLQEGQVVGQDSIAKDAMLNEGKVSEEEWAGEEEGEKANYVQEELYIHGKVLIVDDRIALCGSSNINDRSQLGFHDSELSIVMEDYNVLDSTMDGKPYKAGQHAATLRRMLWREHLGLLPAQSLDAKDDPNAQPPGDCPNDVQKDETYEFVADPLGDEVWDMWTGRATKNTEVFRYLFHADPDDNSEWSLMIYALFYPIVLRRLLTEPAVKTFDDYASFVPRQGDAKHKQGHLYNPYQPVAEVRRALDDIKGHLVWMPLDFLEDAEMAEKGMQVNEWTESIYT